jgi:two-component system, OmpR family, sensor histidine kinase TctE
VIRFAPEQRSLFGEILDWMLAPLLLLWPMSVALTWVVAQGIANRPYDRNLGDTAVTLARRVSDVPTAAAGQPTMRLDVQPQALDLLRSDDVDRIYFQVLGRRGEVVAGDRDMPVPDALGAGGALQFRDESIQGDNVRVAYLWLPSVDPSQPPRAMVQVAETLNKRSQLATEIIKGVILPQFIILPLAVVLVWFALARGMAPLNALQQRIRKRESHDLSPLDEQDVPEEVSPLVGSINDLLARLDVSIGAQKHFLADAAHQLKTPLAGLRTQAELAQRELSGGDAASARRSLQNIARSSQRAAHMVNQLLALARAEDEEMRLLTQDVNLLRLAQDVVSDFFGRASDKAIDLGLEAADAQAPLVPVWVRGQAVLVRELMRNLVDNALHHAPSGGRVTVRVLHDPFGQVAVLQVEDDGPGVAPAERDLVFQAFYRAPDNRNEGSGLGLAIVREIAQSHGATVALEDVHPRVGPRGGAAAGTPNVGARFTVRFKAVAVPANKITPP